MSVLMQSFVFSNFNYCPLIWHFSSSKSLRKNRVNSKKGFVRFLLDDDKSSYTELLSKSEKSSMDVNRLKTLCTEIFKTLNGLNPAYLQDVFQKSFLSKSEKSSMDVNRLKTLCTEIFKTLNGLNPAYLQDVFQKSLYGRPYRNGNKNNLIKPAVNTVSNIWTKRLSSLGPLIWNKLPGHIKTSETVLAVKHALKFWNGEKCLCKMCEST